MADSMNSAVSESEIKISPRIKFVDLRQTLTELSKLLSELLDSKRIGLYLRGRETGNWALAVSRQLTPLVEEKARVINQDRSEMLYQSLNKREPCLLEEILDAELAESVKGENLIIAPLWCGSEAMGLLLADFDAYASLTDRHLIQLRLAAHLLKTSIEKEFLGIQVKEIEKNLASKSIPDVHKHLYNDQLIKWVIDREIERAIRHGGGFAIMIIALDNITHLMSQYDRMDVNIVQDQALEAMDYIIRKCDMIARRGGDRFICFSVQQNEAGAFVLAEKLRHRIKATSFKFKNENVSGTISIGIALWPQGPKIKASELISRAESAFQDALSKGNRVGVWRPNKM